ncbi:MAG: carbohydrate porin [Deltaproteobacteria bacterium]
MAGIRRDWIIQSIIISMLSGALLIAPLASKKCRGQTTPLLSAPAFAPRQEELEQTGEGGTGRLSIAKKAGVTLHLTYTGETFHGIRTIPDGATRYRGLVEVEAALDTEQAGLWPGGKLFIKGQNGHGKGFVVSPGGIPLRVSDIGAPDFTQLSQYGVKQSFPGGKGRIILGKQNVNDYFSVNVFGRSFIFPAYTLIPTVPMPTFPAPALGASIFVEPATSLSLGVGVYDGSPEIGGLGFDTAFDGRGGYFSIGELTWKPCPGAGGECRHRYSLGLWYHSGQFPDLEAASDPGTLSGNYGGYLMIERLLFRERGRRTGDQGLGGFFQLGWAPGDRNAVTKYVGLGFTYKGLFPGCDEDTLGIGASYTWLMAKSPVKGSRTHLSNIELFYKVPVNSWLSLQPDVQYYDNPGQGANKAFALGFRWLIRF